MKDRHFTLPLIKIGRVLCFPVLIPLLMLATACKTSDDAKAAASQMATTAKDLTGYYAQIDAMLENTIRLDQLQSALLSTPFDSQSLAQIKETEQEIGKREEAAKNLQEVSDALSKLTASSDISTATGNLSTALSAITTLPGGAAIPDALPSAGKEIETLLREHKEREAAAAMDGTVSALAQLYEKETPVYESLCRQYFVLAQSLAKELIERKWIDEGVFLAPALEPFGFSSLISARAMEAASPDTAAKLKSYALAQIDSQATEKTEAQQKATAGLGQALDEMSKRIHQLATDKTMPQRGSPPSLADVESWMETTAPSSHAKK
jgi:hypothetical protein